jgi:hypothetical protein
MQVRLIPKQSIQPVTTRVAPLIQLAGIAWYEFKMHWRRRGIKVLTLAGTAGIVLAILFASDVSFFLPNSPALSTMSARGIQIVHGEYLSFYTVGLIVVSLFMMPILLADSVPNDEQFHVAELMNAAPVTAAVFLAGKAGGAILAALSSLLLNGVLYIGLWRLRSGAYYGVPVMDTLIILSIMTVLATGFAVLVGATQPSNRRALMLAVILVLVPEFLQGLPLVSIIFPSRIVILMHMMDASLNNLVNMPLIVRQMIFASAFMIRLYLYASLQLVVTFGLVWAWRHYRGG